MKPNIGAKDISERWEETIASSIANEILFSIKEAPCEFNEGYQRYFINTLASLMSESFRYHLITTWLPLPFMKINIRGEVKNVISLVSLSRHLFDNSKFTLTREERIIINSTKLFTTDFLYNKPILRDDKRLSAEITYNLLKLYLLAEYCTKSVNEEGEPQAFDFYKNMIFSHTHDKLQEKISDELRILPNVDGIIYREHKKNTKTKLIDICVVDASKNEDSDDFDDNEIEVEVLTKRRKIN